MTHVCHSGTVSQPLCSPGNCIFQECLHMHKYSGFESNPVFDHIWNVAFTWNMKNLAIQIPVYMILTVSRFLIVCQ